MRRLLPLLLLAAACASSANNRPADVPKPDIVVRQVGMIFFGSSSTAPVSIDVHIRNNARIPIRLREINLRSMGMTQYALLGHTRNFSETIEPGQSRTFGLTATAVTNTSRPQNEPLSLQANVRFEANGKGFREVVLERMAGLGM
jgi:hypothetical protein